MSDAKPAREFWISDQPHGKNINGKVNLYTAITEKPQNPPWVHVIEKSAYDQLQAQFKMKQNDWIIACQQIDKLEKQVADLEAEVTQVKAAEEAATVDLNDWVKRADKLQSQLARYKEALEFYAIGYTDYDRYVGDKGKIARQALEEP